MANATVASKSVSSQPTTTAKPDSTSKLEALREILYAVQVQGYSLNAGEMKILHDAATRYAQAALAISSTNDADLGEKGYDEYYFSSRLSVLAECLRSAESGFDKSRIPEHMQAHCSSIVAVAIFGEARRYAEMEFDEAKERLEMD